MFGMLMSSMLTQGGGFSILSSNNGQGLQLEKILEELGPLLEQLGLGEQKGFLFDRIGGFGGQKGFSLDQIGGFGGQKGFSLDQIGGFGGQKGFSLDQIGGLPQVQGKTFLPTDIPQPVQHSTVPEPITPLPPPLQAQSSAPSNGGQIVQTGTGTGQYYVVTNNTSRTQTFAFTSGSSIENGFSNNPPTLMTLKPGETGTFESGPNVPGIRINTTGPNGETHGNEALYEDTVQTNPMTGVGIVHNPDVSNVAGHVGYYGDPQNITVSNGERTIGNGTQTGAYQNWNDDTNPNPETNPMNMALDPHNTYYIVFSDA